MATVNQPIHPLVDSTRSLLLAARHCAAGRRKRCSHDHNMTCTWVWMHNV